jgi:hypothetical protein
VFGLKSVKKTAPPQFADRREFLISYLEPLSYT